MTPVQPPSMTLLRFALQSLRISASTVALVALLRDQWLLGVGSGLAWLFLLILPRLIPRLAEPDTSAPQGPMIR
jgi:hypothetical protein